MQHEHVLPCAAGVPPPIPPLGIALDDEEGERLDPDLPHVVDAHVHLFPPRMFDAIWRWFDRYGWPIRHKLYAREVLDFLLGRGVGKIVALHYAHKPGIARSLNAFMGELVQGEPRVRGVATVFPGEPEAVAILREGFASGLGGVKLHCHVQGLAADAAPLHEIYSLCQSLEEPVVIHAGREPRSAAYPVDPHAICHVDRVEAVLRSFPRLRLCVPHLGADEFDAYGRLLERYDNLWLDTTMALGDYFPPSLGGDPRTLLEVRPERVFYGSDFPNVPYAWDRELARIKGFGLSDARLDTLLSQSAKGFYRLS